MGNRGHEDAGSRQKECRRSEDIKRSMHGIAVLMYCFPVDSGSALSSIGKFNLVKAIGKFMGRSWTRPPTGVVSVGLITSGSRIPSCCPGRRAMLRPGVTDTTFDLRTVWKVRATPLRAMLLECRLFGDRPQPPQTRLRLRREVQRLRS